MNSFCVTGINPIISQALQMLAFDAGMRWVDESRESQTIKFENKPELGFYDDGYLTCSDRPGALAMQGLEPVDCISEILSRFADFKQGQPVEIEVNGIAGKVFHDGTVFLGDYVLTPESIKKLYEMSQSKIGGDGQANTPVPAISFATNLYRADSGQFQVGDIVAYKGDLNRLRRVVRTNVESRRNPFAPFGLTLEVIKDPTKRIGKKYRVFSRMYSKVEQTPVVAQQPDLYRADSGMFSAGDLVAADGNTSMLRRVVRTNVTSKTDPSKVNGLVLEVVSDPEKEIGHKFRAWENLYSLVETDSFEDADDDGWDDCDDDDRDDDDDLYF